MRPLLLLVSAATAVLAPLASQAQQVSLESSSVIGCLTPPPAERGEPEYPFAAWKNGEKGRVLVDLIFTIPDGRPEVRVVQSEGNDSFVSAVKDHVRTLRAPCLRNDEVPARVRFDYVFQPDDRRVHWARPVDLQDDDRRRMLRCVLHTSGKPAPEYPLQALRQEVQGRVLVRLSFSAPDQPPAAEIFMRPSAEPLRGVIERWVQDYRMPCQQGAPLQAVWTFVFRFEGDAFGFKPLELMPFLGAVRGIQSQRVQFDLTRMDCPFNLKLQYRQPHMPNSVGEIGGSNAARRPFIEWLQTLQLDLPRRTQDSVFADSTTLAVPCLKIDLKPKE